MNARQRFVTWFNSLPAYGQAGAGWPILLFRKTETGNKYNLFPKNRFHVGSGTSAKIYTAPDGKQYVIGAFLSTRGDIYASNYGVWNRLSEWQVNFENIRQENNSNYNFQHLPGGSVWFWWRQIDEPENPFLMIYPSEEAELLSIAGFNRIPFDGDLIITETAKEPGTGGGQQTEIEQRKASSYGLVIIGFIGFVLLTGAALLLYKK